MKNVFLHGNLGEKFGYKWELDVSTPAEAVRAICANKSSFRKYLIEKVVDGVNYGIKVGDRFLLENEADIADSEDTYNILPAPAGSGELIAFLIIAAIAAGISYVLFSQSKPPRPDDPTQKSSFLFQGAVNTTAQGGFVPIGYGRLRVGSSVISASSISAPMSQITTKTAISLNIQHPTINN